VCRLNAHLLAPLSDRAGAPQRVGRRPSPGMVRRLQEAGFDRLWLGSEGWEALCFGRKRCRPPKQAGFLIGPYDSYNSVHRTNEPNTWPTAQFDSALYANWRHCESRRHQRNWVQEGGLPAQSRGGAALCRGRVSRLMAAFHANSWFMDCDGFGEYFDDYSEQHPATQQSDMAARISRMAWIRDTFGAVIGRKAARRVWRRRSTSPTAC